jgi:hypothetical protein
MTGHGEAICAAVVLEGRKTVQQTCKPANVGPCGRVAHNEAVKASRAPCGCEPFPSKVGQVSAVSEVAGRSDRFDSALAHREDVEQVEWTDRTSCWHETLATSPKAIKVACSLAQRRNREQGGRDGPPADRHCARRTTQANSGA